MQTESTVTVEDIVKAVKRFRILCVGRAGVGKSSIINRVFGVEEAQVEHWKAGEANIEREFTAPDNDFFVLHDSKGFETGSTETLNAVSKFIEERCNEDLPLEKRLHAVWLCTETPRAGGRIFEAGDEDVLKVAHRTRTPVVVVFTKYDLLVRTKKADMKSQGRSEDLDELSKEEAQKALDSYVQSLENAMESVQAPTPQHVKVSIRSGYEADISSLVDVTCNLVHKYQGDVWVMWAIAQRASVPLKISACTAKGMGYYTRALAGGLPDVEPLLRGDCLVKVHQDIIFCWNFRDDEKILISDEFKELMLYLVHEVQESQNHSESHSAPTPAINKIFQFLGLITTVPLPTAPTLAVDGSTSILADWLKDNVLHNTPEVQRLFMTYAVDLIRVLKSLFLFTLTPQLSGKATWLAMKEAVEEYEHSDSCQQIHRQICANFQQNQQGLDLPSFCRMFSELLEDEGSH